LKHIIDLGGQAWRRALFAGFLSHITTQQLLEFDSAVTFAAVLQMEFDLGVAFFVELTVDEEKNLD